MVQQGPILAALKANSAQLVSATETLDTTTPIGQAIVGFVVAQAEQESLNTSLRVAKAEQRRIEAGLPHGGGKRSFGYGRDTGDRVADAKVRGVVNKSEAKIIRQVAKRLMSGESLRQIAKWLNEQGVTTTTGRTWSHSTLRQMISSPKLRGERIHNGKTTPLEDWTPILTAEEQFVALDAVEKARATARLLSESRTSTFCRASSTVPSAALRCTLTTAPPARTLHVPGRGFQGPLRSERRDSKNR